MAEPVTESFVNFTSLIAQQKLTLSDLPVKDYIVFGNHVFVFDVEVDITSLLLRLREDTELRKKEGATPFTHLHIYCHRLTAYVDWHGTVETTAQHSGGQFEFIEVFAATIPPFKHWSFLSTAVGPMEMRLHYDVQSGPSDFWLNVPTTNAQDLPSYHVLVSPQACLDRDADPCIRSPHLDLSTSAAVGIRVKTDAIDGFGRVRSAEVISSVTPEELEPMSLVEFKAFGAHALRLSNLPRLLDSLFTSAGEELMGAKPDINRVLAKLRFISACATDSSHHVRLVKESNDLIERLRLPSPPREQDVIDSSITGMVPSSDWFFVPERNPKAFETAMDATMTALIDHDRRCETQTNIESLKGLIREGTDSMMKTVQTTIKGAVSEHALDISKSEAVDKTVSAVTKANDLRAYDTGLSKAKSAFDAGLDDYKKRMQKKLWIDLLKGIGQMVFDVGLAVYTGGAGAPLLIGDVNKFLKGAKQIEEKSRLFMALKALALSLAKVGPSMYAAFQVHSAESQIGEGSPTEASISQKMEENAAKVTSSTLSGQAGEQVDHLGLLADWREMGEASDLAFANIREDIGKEKINGLDDYELATKNLAIRGETLVQALKEAYDARREYLMLEASQKAYEAAMADIELARYEANAATINEAVGAMSIQYRFNLEIAQGRRVMFNLLHEAVLALVYQTNNVKLQKLDFASLSPAMTATALQDEWASFSRKVSDGLKLLQGGTISLNAKDTLPYGWKGLLSNNLETPFQVSTQLPSLLPYHRLRIRGIAVQFVGLKYTDGRVVDPETLEYSIRFGPFMFDRASPYDGAESKDATIVQYYMPAKWLRKQGSRNNFIDDGQVFAKRALCSAGKISFANNEIKSDLDLASIQDIRLNFEYEAVTFDQ